MFNDVERANKMKGWVSAECQEHIGSDDVTSSLSPIVIKDSSDGFGNGGGRIGGKSSFLDM